MSDWKNVREQLIERFENGEDCEITVKVARPWTYVWAEIDTGDGYLEGFGFAKANWPDRWNEEYGFAMAFRKAVTMMAKEACGIDVDAGAVWFDRLPERVAKIDLCNGP